MGKCISKQSAKNVLLMPTRKKESDDLKVYASGRSFTTQISNSHNYSPLSSTRAYEVIGPSEVQLYRVSIRDSYVACKSSATVSSSNNSPIISQGTSSHFNGGNSKKHVTCSTRVVGFDIHQSNTHKKNVSNLSNTCINRSDIDITTSHTDLTLSFNRESLK